MPTHRCVLLSSICRRRVCLLGIIRGSASLGSIVRGRRLLCYSRSILVRGRWLCCLCRLLVGRIGLWS